MIIHAAGRVITGDASSDRSPPVFNFDPAPPDGVAAPAAPASNTENEPSQSSGPCNEASETPSASMAKPALHVVRSQAPPAPEKRSNENERQGRREEHEKCQPTTPLRVPQGFGEQVVRQLRGGEPAENSRAPAKVIRPEALNPPPMSVQDMQRDLGWLFGPGKPPAGTRQ